MRRTGRLGGIAVRCANSIRERKAEFTASSVGNASRHLGIQQDEIRARSIAPQVLASHARPQILSTVFGTQFILASLLHRCPPISSQRQAYKTPLHSSTTFHSNAKTVAQARSSSLRCLRVLRASALRSFPSQRRGGRGATQRVFHLNRRDTLLNTGLCSQGL